MFDWDESADGRPATPATPGGGRRAGGENPVNPEG
jgi:hypothetical protein